MACRSFHFHPSHELVSNATNIYISGFGLRSFAGRPEHSIYPIADNHADRNTSKARIVSLAAERTAGWLNSPCTAASWSSGGADTRVHPPMARQHMRQPVWTGRQEAAHRVGADCGRHEEGAAAGAQVRTWQGDVADLPAAQLQGAAAVFFNACFGNLFDQRAALLAVALKLPPTAHVVISHPLGRWAPVTAGTHKLRDRDPETGLHASPPACSTGNWVRLGTVG